MATKQEKAEAKAAAEQNEKDETAVKEQAPAEPDAASAPANENDPDRAAEQSDADRASQLHQAEDKGSERNQPRSQTQEAYGDEPLATQTVTHTSQHYPGQPLETVADRDRNNELREEREERVDAQREEYAEAYDLDKDDVPVNAAGEVSVAQPSHTIFGGVDARSPEANVLSRTNIIADGVGTATPLLTRGLDEDGNTIEDETLVQFEARERAAEQEHEVARAKLLREYNESIPSTTPLGPR